MEELSVDVAGVQYAVKRVGTSAKSASARVRSREIIVRIPVHWPREEGFKAFLKLKNKVIAGLQKNPPRARHPLKVQFEDGQVVSVLGKSFSIHCQQGGGRASRARLDGSIIEITLAAGLDEGKRLKHASNLARRVISHSVKPLVEERVQYLNSTHFNFSFRKIFIKEATSRWGSCSQDGNINLNFALLFAPQEVMDYVILHELAHLKEGNHGGEFWRLVGSAMPDFAEKRKWLKENGGRVGAVEEPDAD